jgi:hypothetical protein
LGRFLSEPLVLRLEFEGSCLGSFLLALGSPAASLDHRHLVLVVLIGVACPHALSLHLGIEIGDLAPDVVHHPVMLGPLAYTVPVDHVAAFQRERLTRAKWQGTDGTMDTHRRYLLLLPRLA